MRDRVGAGLIIGMRSTGDEEVEAGLSHNDCIEIAQRLEASGYVDFLNVLNGAT
jgi:2,4-dienoyl-CoA reductase-like NADH-dependent reductase (Old Yellow Enzyme family)